MLWRTNCQKDRNQNRNDARSTGDAEKKKPYQYKNLTVGPVKAAAFFMVSILSGLVLCALTGKNISLTVKRETRDKAPATRNTLDAIAKCEWHAKRWIMGHWCNFRWWPGSWISLQFVESFITHFYKVERRLSADIWILMSPAHCKVQHCIDRDKFVGRIFDRK